MEHRVEVTGIFPSRLCMGYQLEADGEANRRGIVTYISFPHFEYIEHMNLRENSLYIEYPYKRSCPSG